MASIDKTVIGRYRLSDEIASGGMASVHLGRLLGPVGFSRAVAIKRLHPHLARNPDFVAGFLDEARLAARIRHPNVVPTLDVIATDGEVLLVMEYVQGETLARLLGTAFKLKRPPPPAIASAVLVDALHGLHAAHEARDESGAPLNIVHRDVSPQNILVGVDGMSRVLDFGIAKAENRSQETTDGALKGKLGYMSPEQATGQPLDRRSDVFSAGVVLWEALTATRLFPSPDGGAVLLRIVHDPIPALPADVATPELAAIVARSLAKDPSARFATAEELAIALERAVPRASPREVAEWVSGLAGASLERRAATLAELERERLSEPPLDVPRAAPSSSRAAAATVPFFEETTVAAEPAPMMPPRPPLRRPALVLGGLAVLIGGGAYALGARRADVPATNAGAPATVAAEPTASASPGDAPPASAPDEVVAQTSPTTRPSPAAEVASTRPKPVTTSRAPRRAPVPAAPHAPTGCETPTYFDEHGIKHVKPGCLR